MSIQIVEVQCPHCGEFIEIEVEPTSESQSYIQDCSVCCRPIRLEVAMGEDAAEVNAFRSD